MVGFGCVNHAWFIHDHDHNATQGPEIQTVFDKGLSALSAQEVEQLLSHLGLARFLSDFKKENVSVSRILFLTKYILDSIIDSSA